MNKNKQYWRDLALYFAGFCIGSFLTLILFILGGALK